MNDTPERVSENIKEIIRKQYGNLSAYAQEKNITPTQLYTILNGKEYISLFSAVRFSNDLDLNIEYCTSGRMPIYKPEHDYNILVAAAKDFFYSVKEEDDFREKYISQYEGLSPEERQHSTTILNKLRIQKAKAACCLVDVLGLEWPADESNKENIIQPIKQCKMTHSTKPMVKQANSMTLHEAIVTAIKESEHPLTFSEVAGIINKKGLYFRKDGLDVPASQISARVKNYPHLFAVNTETSPKTISLTKDVI